MDGNVGHNSGIAADVLRSYLERVERLSEEKAGLAADIRDVYAEAKGNGFDPKIMRQMVKLRAMDPTDLQEYEEMIDVYRAAIGL